MLVGKRPTAEAFRPAAEKVLQNAKGYRHNTFKIELGKRAIVRALEEAAQMREQ